MGYQISKFIAHGIQSKNFYDTWDESQPCLSRWPRPRTAVSTNTGNAPLTSRPFTPNPTMPSYHPPPAGWPEKTTTRYFRRLLDLIKLPHTIHLYILWQNKNSLNKNRHSTQKIKYEKTWGTNNQLIPAHTTRLLIKNEKKCHEG